MQPNVNPEPLEQQMMSKPATNVRGNLRGNWNRLAAALGLGLLLAVPLGFTALDYLVPKHLSQGKSALTRASWYLRSAQWQGDIRTLVCALDYVLGADPETPVGVISPTKQLTATSEPSIAYAPTETQVRTGGLGFVCL